MTIIEDAMKRLEGQKTDAEPEKVEAVGTVVENKQPSKPGKGQRRKLNNGDRLIKVDRDALRRVGLMAPEDEERHLMDQYRNIKRPLVAHAFGIRATKVPDGHLILVSSAVPGEGKTFTCINLALSIAMERDRSVLLVDADVAKPHISRLFGVEDRPGLLDLLDDSEAMDYADTILATDVPRLSIMPAGHVRANATELLASAEMEKLIRHMEEDDPDRIILFDSPPILVTSEARILTSLVGQIALVVHAGQTPQQAVLDAVSTIHEDKPVNLILNQARHSGVGNYYGGYYGYGQQPEGGNDAN